MIPELLINTIMLHFIVASLVLRACQGSYDEYFSCDREARSSRALELPSDCDLGRYSFCHHKGNAYPDKAIKRFLKENLGLMKRMSSDVEPREVVREMRSGFNIYSHPEHDEEREQSRTVKAGSFSMNMMPPGENIFNGLKYNIKLGSGLAMVQNAKDQIVGEFEEEIEEEDFDSEAGWEEGSTSQTSTSQTTMIVSSTQSSSEAPAPATTALPASTTIAPSTVTEQGQLTTTTMMESDTTVEGGQDGRLETTGSPQSEPVYYQTDYSQEYREEYGEEYREEGDEYQVYGETEDLQPISSHLIDLQEELASLDPATLEQQLPEILQIFEAEVEQAEAGQELEYREPGEEQPLQEEEEGSGEMVFDYTGDPINACDVTESVQAPYWANNTRNQTLALLNLYPFEQYIHMETCKAEYAEMLCRPGCRCEQQYRLHRLLAFDPNNECRGIFSDWFRFPSFCICKCYSSARQFKQIVRSPKSRRPAPAPAGPGRLAAHRVMSVSGVDGMPAVFPYEGLAMITDQRRASKQIQQPAAQPRRMEEPQQVANRRLNQPEEEKLAEKVVDDVVGETLLDKIAEEHMDNTVESELDQRVGGYKQARHLDPDHFFYNQPILEFALTDGTVGTVQQAPRK